jgi:outer membrane protein TolC
MQRGWSVHTNQNSTGIAPIKARNAQFQVQGQAGTIHRWEMTPGVHGMKSCPVQEFLDKSACRAERESRVTIAGGQEESSRRRAQGARCAAILAILGSVTACVHYQAAPLSPERNARDFAARRLAEPRLREQVSRLLPQTAGAWPPQEWDRAQLLAVALAQNPQFAVAQSQVNAALSHEITAGELPNPDLTVQSEYARHEVHPWLYGLSLNWLLRSSGRRRLDTEMARLETGNARLQLMDQAWAVRRALAAALTEWEGARRRLILLERLGMAQDLLIAVEQTRISAGEDAPLEIINLQQTRIQVEQQQAELRSAATAAQAAAAKVLGLPPQALDHEPFTWSDWGAPPPLDEKQERVNRERALLSRADFAIAVGEYAQAENRLKLSIARQYPELDVEPGYYWDHGVAKFPFNLGITLPLNRNRGEIAEARAGRDVAGLRLTAVQAEIYGDIAAAERAELVARAAAGAAERQLASAQRRKQHADLSLRLGADDQTAQIGAEIAITRAELEVIQMQTQLQNSRNSLEDALHAPLSGPELALAESMFPNISGAGP